MSILSVQDLSISFNTPAGWLRVVDGLSFEIKKGDCLGIVGESGCGKSVALASILGLTTWANGRIDAGKILFEGQNLLECNSEDWRRVRGRKISMIFQDPMTALNPLKKCGDQVAEVLTLNTENKESEAVKAKVIALFEELGIPEPRLRYDQYPHELSGGLRQRIVIAMALIGEPELILCDEPTTALDVSIQAQILELLKDLQKKRKLTMIFVSHNMGVIKQISDFVMVMYAGRAVEKTSREHLFANPSHPYTQKLLQSIPDPFLKIEGPLATIPGKVPSPREFVQGCRFYNRCEKVQKDCASRLPCGVNILESKTNEQIEHWVDCALVE
jgi:peptide/nickel transport system ATP-binding protein